MGFAIAQPNLRIFNVSGVLHLTISHSTVSSIELRGDRILEFLGVIRSIDFSLIKTMAYKCHKCDEQILVLRLGSCGNCREPISSEILPESKKQSLLT
jgi:hypothetical protein